MLSVEISVAISSHLTQSPNLWIGVGGWLCLLNQEISQWGLGGCQGDTGVFIFHVVRRVIMVYDRDRGGNLRPAQ